MTQVGAAKSSRGFGFIQLGDRGKKARAVSFQFHRSYSADVLQRTEGPGTPDRQLRESTIGEYNIRRHLFLARDARANRFKGGEGSLLYWPKGKVFTDLNWLAFSSSGFFVTAS